MEVVDDGAATQVKEVLAAPSVTRSRPLPPPYMGQGMLHLDPFAQLGSALWRQLPLT